MVLVFAACVLAGWGIFSVLVRLTALEVSMNELLHMLVPLYGVLCAISGAFCLKWSQEYDKKIEEQKSRGLIPRD